MSTSSTVQAQRCWAAPALYQQSHLLQKDSTSQTLHLLLAYGTSSDLGKPGVIFQATLGYTHRG